MNNPEDVEKAMLLQQSGEISMEDLKRLETTLQTDVQARETKKMNNAIIRAARDSMAEVPLDEVTRERILAAAREAIQAPPKRSVLPLLAAAAVMVFLLALAFAAFKSFAPAGPGIAQEPRPTEQERVGDFVDETEFDAQLEQLSEKLARISSDDPFAAESELDLLAEELLLLSEIQI